MEASLDLQGSQCSFSMPRGNYNEQATQYGDEMLDFGFPYH
jgi:hypothetical protein